MSSASRVICSKADRSRRPPSLGVVLQFAGLRLAELLPDETTIQDLSSFAGEARLGEGLFNVAHAHLASCGHRSRTIVDEAECRQWRFGTQAHARRHEINAWQERAKEPRSRAGGLATHDRRRADQTEITLPINTKVMVY